MALNLRRAAFTALVLAAVLLPLRPRGRPAPDPNPGDRQDRSRALAEELSSIVFRWSAQEQRDSALALIGASADRLPLIVLSGFPDAAGPAKTDLADLSGLAQRIGPGDSMVRIGVLAYSPDRYQHRSGWGLYQGNLIVQRNGITWCIAIVTAYSTRLEPAQIGRHRLSWATAPCAFLAAFGPPGDGVGRWLGDLGYGPARVSPWVAPWVSGNRDGPWSALPDRSFIWPRESRGFLLSRAIGAERIAHLLAPPYWFGAPGLRCIAGDSTSCREAVLQSGISGRGEQWLTPDLTVSLSRFPPPPPGSVIGLTTARPPGSSFLADLVHSQGRERFQAFWRSDRPVADAFAEAFGEPLGDWTARWARDLWLSTWEARYRSPDIILGVTLRPSWPILALSWTVVTILLAGLIARRRQVT